MTTYETFEGEFEVDGFKFTYRGEHRDWILLPGDKPPTPSVWEARVENVPSNWRTKGGSALGYSKEEVVANLKDYMVRVKHWEDMTPEQKEEYRKSWVRKT